MTKQRTARLHPAIDSRTRLCELDHGTNYTRVCNAALWHFFNVADGAARKDALNAVTRMMRCDTQKSIRRSGHRPDVQCATAVSAVLVHHRELETVR